MTGDLQVGVAIVVASIKQNDPVQPNIYNVTDAAYQMFRDNGYTDDRIIYLAPDRNHSPNVMRWPPSMHCAPPSPRRLPNGWMTSMPSPST
ncbi:MAG: hypothetical protein R2851_21730 [Caldilineaceae bacterium]